MKPKILYFSPVVLLYLAAATTQLVAASGCEQRLDCTECLRSEDCEFLPCGTGHNTTSYCSNKTERNTCNNKEAAITDVQHCPTTNPSTDAAPSNETSTATIVKSPIRPTPPDATLTAITPSTVSMRAATVPSTTTTTTSPMTTTTTAPAAARLLLSSSLSPPPSMFTPMGHSTSVNRRFDGPSFLGGIILSFGLLAVAYVGFKFYRARTERNYHTLRETSLHI